MSASFKEALAKLSEALDTLESRSQTNCGAANCVVCPRNRAELAEYRAALVTVTDSVEAAELAK